MTIVWLVELVWTNVLLVLYLQVMKSILLIRTFVLSVVLVQVFARMMQLVFHNVEYV